MPEQYCCKCCKDMDIELQHLMFPELYLSEDAQYFLKLWNVGRLPLNELRSHLEVIGDGKKVKVRVPCAQLTEEGLCGVYDQRPQLCREYSCESRAIMGVKDRCEPAKKYIELKVVNA